MSQSVIPLKREISRKPPGSTEKKTRRLCAFLSVACVWLMIGIPIGTVMIPLFAEDATLAQRAHLRTIDIIVPIALWQRCLAAAVSLLPAFAAVLAVENARRCFRLCAKGRFFDGEIVSRLRSLAGWGCAFAAASFCTSALLSVLLSLQNPAGKHFISIGIDPDGVTALFFAGLVWVIAAVIARAKRAVDENSQFV